MEVNLKGAARNAYEGVKELVVFLEDAREEYSDVNDLLDDAESIIVRNQPMLAAYCVHEHFNGERQEPQLSDLEIVQKALGSGDFALSCRDGNCYISDIDMYGDETPVITGSLVDVLTWAKQTVGE